MKYRVCEENVISQSSLRRFCKSVTYFHFANYRFLEICNLRNGNMLMMCKIEICHLRNGNMRMMCKIEICHLRNGNMPMIFSRNEPGCNTRFCRLLIDFERSTQCMFLEAMCAMGSSEMVANIDNLNETNFSNPCQLVLDHAKM